MNQAERNANAECVAQAIKLACKGNRQAEEYLWSVARIARILDDHTDGDHEADVTRLVAETLVNMPQNLFYMQEQHRLVPMQALSLNAWIDSNKWNEAGGERQKQSKVFRDYINETVQLVALIVGGWDHMREVSLKIRELFFKID